MLSLPSLFPLLAIIVSLLAWQEPAPLIGWKGAVVPLLVVIMFCMGLTLRWQDFRRIARKPKPLVLGVCLQFLSMPLLGWLLGKALQLPDDIALGLIVVGCCAGGTASNVITYLAGGDVALSVSMTLASTLAGVVLTPLMLQWYAAANVSIDTLLILIATAKMVVIPLLAGLLVSRWLPQWRRALLPHLGNIATLAILTVIAIIVALNADELGVVGLTTLIAVICHNMGGLIIGYLGGRLSGCTEAEARTLAIEVGMQNSGLGAALALKFFTPMVALPAALFSCWHNVSGSLVAALCRYLTRQRVKQASAANSFKSGCSSHASAVREHET